MALLRNRKFADIRWREVDFEPSVPREEKAYLRWSPKGTLLRVATRIGDGDIGSGLKYDVLKRLRLGGTQSRLRAATLLAAVGQRIGAVRDGFCSPFR